MEVGKKYRSMDGTATWEVLRITNHSLYPIVAFNAKDNEVGTFMFSF